MWKRVLETARKLGDALDETRASRHLLLQHEQAIAQPALSTIYTPSVFVTTPAPPTSPAPRMEIEHGLVEDLKGVSDVPLVVLYPRSVKRMAAAAAILAGVVLVVWLVSWLFSETQE